MVLKLLSAGVITAMVTGLFSLIIAIKNNSRLLEIEKSKQQFTVEQERYKDLRSAYNELIELIPEEKHLGHIIMNLQSKENNGLFDVYEVAQKNMQILYTHYKKHCYLLAHEDQDKVNDAVEKIDYIEQSIISCQLQLRTSNQNELNEEDKIISDTIFKNVQDRLYKGTEFEELYFDVYKQALNQFSSSDNKRK